MVTGIHFLLKADEELLAIISSFNTITKTVFPNVQSHISFC